MTPLNVSVLAAFLVFCRIGGCVMLMPGIAGYRLPVRIRLFLAASISLALTPVLHDQVAASLEPESQAKIIFSIASELATGAIIGLLARLFFLSIQTMLVAVGQFIGLTTAMPSVEEDEALPPVATLMAIAATTMMFITDQHFELLRGLIASYQRIPPGFGFEGRGALREVTDKLAVAFLLALRIASPFLVYSIAINLAVGITNKLVPTIPVYFISMPFVTAGGLLLLYVISDQMLTAFVMAFGAFLRSG